MKKVLCFGDSNTFGYNPKDGSRFDKNTRWTALLKNKISDNFEIIEAGCNDRTGFVEHYNGGIFSGSKILPSYIEKGVDVVVLAIGINDLQKFYSVSDLQIEEGLKRLINIIKTKNISTKILIVLPPRLNENVLKGNFAFQFDENSIKKSLGLEKIYKPVALENNCDYMDLGIEVSQFDGLHYDEDGHKKIAEKMYEYLKTI